ncbi:MAG: pentapeptide repeat-containing protein [Bacteroidia bacterium]
MKGIKRLLLVSILGLLILGILAAIAWAFSFENRSFWGGVLSILGLITLSLWVLRSTKKDGFLAKLIQKEPSSDESKRSAIAAMLLTCLLIFGALMFFQHSQLQLQQIETQNYIDQENERLLRDYSRNNLGSLIGNLLDKVETELADPSFGQLSDKTIARIAAVSEAFKPAGEVISDSLGNENYSLERGQLLLALSYIEMDSNSFGRIKAKVSFAGADLAGADWAGINLRGADLRGANLREANLAGAKLDKADLRSANFWNANLSKASLQAVYLNRADLRWANLNEADLRWAVLNGADLSNAKLKNANLKSASFRWAIARSALFNEATVSCVDLKGTDLRDANLSQCDLRETDLGSTNLSGADLRKANLVEANMKGFNPMQMTETMVFEENWLQMLTQWKVRGADLVQARFKVVREVGASSRFYLDELDE